MVSYNHFITENYNHIKFIYINYILELNSDITFESFCKYAYYHSI